MTAQRSTLAAGTRTGLDATDVDYADQDIRHTEHDGDTLLYAPELDDLTDTDNLVAVRLERRLDLDAEFAAYLQNADAPTDVLPRVGGQHRKPGTSTLKSRVLIAAVAVGGVAAATYSAANPGAGETAKTVLAANYTDAATGTAIAGSSRGAQLVTVAPIASGSLHSEELAKGAAFAQERANREARLQRPLFVKPTNGIFTSGYGARWGAMHAGVDLAAPIGTPIYAVADGVVTDAGPTAGFGAWVKIRHSDGTVTLYGHIDTWTVSVGQRVFAGDQIATVGNRGQSTGPHCHFSVLQNGTDYIDPQPWLAQRGITLGSYVG